MSGRGSSAWRAEVWGPGCNTSVIVACAWVPGAGNIWCHRDCVGAFRALGRVFRKHRYPVRSDVTGCYNCRKITGGTAPSAHAQGIALDANWDTNPYRTDHVVTDMPPAMIHDVQALTTDAGVVVFRWGGDWDGRPETPNSNYDAMHFEVIATPEELRAGFTVPAFNIAEQADWPLLGKGERGPAVEQLQQILADRGARLLTADGMFGPRTEESVQAYQTQHLMPVDGVVGLGTWTALLTNAPIPLPGESGPHKGQAGPLAPSRAPLAPVAPSGVSG